MSGARATTVQFDVPGAPVGKGRPRAGRSFGGHVRMYTPERTVNYESTVALFAAQAMAGRPLIAGPVKLGLNIELAIPASWSKKKQAAALAGTVRPCVKPDVDNVAKIFGDALNGVVWKDDTQIVLLVASKAYSDTPRVQVFVEQLGEAA